MKTCSQIANVRLPFSLIHFFFQVYYWHFILRPKHTWTMSQGSRNTGTNWKERYFLLRCLSGWSLVCVPVWFLSFALDVRRLPPYHRWTPSIIWVSEDKLQSPSQRFFKLLRECRHNSAGDKHLAGVSLRLIPFTCIPGFLEHTDPLRLSPTAPKLELVANEDDNRSCQVFNCCLSRGSKTLLGMFFGSQRWRVKQSHLHTHLPRYHMDY